MSCLEFWSIGHSVDELQNFEFAVFPLLSHRLVIWIRTRTGFYLSWQLDLHCGICGMSLYAGVMLYATKCQFLRMTQVSIETCQRVGKNPHLIKRKVQNPSKTQQTQCCLALLSVIGHSVWTHQFCPMALRPVVSCWVCLQHKPSSQWQKTYLAFCYHRLPSHLFKCYWNWSIVSA